MSDPIRKALADLVRIYMDVRVSNVDILTINEAWAAARAALAEQPSVREPLTDEQIDAIGKRMLGVGYGGNTDRDFARAIEAAHGIGVKGEA